MSAQPVNAVANSQQGNSLAAVASSVVAVQNAHVLNPDRRHCVLTRVFPGDGKKHAVEKCCAVGSKLDPLW